MLLALLLLQLSLLHSLAGAEYLEGLYLFRGQVARGYGGLPLASVKLQLGSGLPTFKPLGVRIRSPGASDR